MDKNISVIVEHIKDNDLIVKPLETKDNKPLSNINDCFPQHETLLWIVAPTGGGKTTLIQYLLAVPYKEFFNRVYFFSSTMDSPKNDWDKFKLNNERIFTNYSDVIFKKILDEIKTDATQKSLIIVDDMSATSLFNRNNLLAQFVTNHRHFNTSIWYISHQYKGLNKQVRTIVKDLIVFHLNSNVEIYELATDNKAHLSYKDFGKIFNACTKEPFSFMYIKRECKDRNKTFRCNFNKILQIKYEDDDEEESIKNNEPIKDDKSDIKE